MKKSVSFSTNGFQAKYGDRKALEIAKRLGADAVDFDLHNMRCDYRTEGSIYQKSDEEIVKYYTELGEYAKSIGLLINQTHGRGAGLRGDAAEDEALLANSRLDFMATKALGAKYCVVHNPTTICTGPDAPAELMRDLSYEMFKVMIGYAKQYDVIVASETFGDAMIYDCVDFFGDIDEFEMSCKRVMDDPELRDNFAVCIDTGHSHKAVRFGNPSVGDVIRRMGKAIKVLHLHDNNGLVDQHKMPFAGTIEWKDVFAALNEVGYDGVYNMEMNYSLYGDDFQEETVEFAIKLMRNAIK